MMRSLNLLSRAALAAPLALALAACGGDAGDAAAEGETVAEVAAPDGASWSQTATRTEEGGWRVGNPNAPITLIEYGSLTCPACAAFSTEGSQPLHENYVDTGRVAYEFRSVLIHGVVDLLLTRMLECAPDPVAVPLADQVWANLDEVTGGVQANSPQLEAAMDLPEDQRFVRMAEAGGIIDFFAARGVSSEQARACLADSAAIERLAEVTQGAAEEDGVSATPTFLLNGNRIDGTRWSAVEAALQQAGAR